MLVSSPERLDGVVAAFGRADGLEVRSFGPDRFGLERDEFPSYILVRSRGERREAVASVLRSQGFAVDTDTPTTVVPPEPEIEPNTSFRLQEKEDIRLLRAILADTAKLRAEVAGLRNPTPTTPVDTLLAEAVGHLEEQMAQRGTMLRQTLEESRREFREIAEAMARDPETARIIVNREDEFRRRVAEGIAAERALRETAEAAVAAAREREDRWRRDEEALESQIEQADVTIRKLRADLRLAEIEIARLRGKLAEAAERPAERVYPVSATLVQAVERLAGVAEGRVEVFPSAYASAKRATCVPNLLDTETGQEVDRVLDAVAALPELLESTDLESEFYRRTGYELALREKTSTRAQRELMRAREFADAHGTVHRCEAHVKHVFSGGQFRVYLCLDGRRVRVGHVGDHLRTHGSGR